MDSKYQAAKNYNYVQDIALNQYIDTKDTVNHWCVGEVIDINDENNQVKIHFEGWTTRYDEVSMIPFWKKFPDRFLTNSVIDNEKELTKTSSIQKTH